MINLLPLKQKKELKSRYHSAFITFFGISILVGIIMADIFLFSTYILLSVDKKSSINDLSILEKDISEETKQAKATIADFQKKIKILQQETLSIRLTDVVDTISRKSTSDISINSISYSVTKNKEETENIIEIIIGGVSEKRESLLSFIRILRDEGGYEVSDSPISELIKDINIPFTLFITIQP